MALHSYKRALDGVSAHLPFTEDDFGQVNETFARWRAGREETDKRVIDIWTYCFVSRYFLFHFLRSADRNRVDCDLLVAQTLRKVSERAGTLRHADRYAAWVSVVCRNTYLNYVRRKRPVRMPDRAEEVPARVETPGRSLDAPVVRRATRDAIERLPDFLRDIARMRLIENRSYAAISAATGKPVPTLRAYVNKAVRRLRRDPAIAVLRPGAEKRRAV